MTAYYNEIDPYAAQWLRNLIAAGHIAPGIVDERSIEDIIPGELNEYAQCHFFAGIGCWSYALRLAGWPDDRPVWTGSCPCQPFSTAGKGAGVADKRHLWPAWFHLIESVRPPVLFGEQVEAAINYGWLDLVQIDLEGIGYAVGASGLPAASVGAPFPRPRLYFVADSMRERLARSGQDRKGVFSRGEEEQPQRGLGGLSKRVSFDPDPKRVPDFNGAGRPVGRLRAYGNAIVPQVAEAFIRSYLEAVDLQEILS